MDSLLKIKRMHVEARLGEWIEAVARACILLATKHDCSVLCKFDDIPLEVFANDSIVRVLAHYDAIRAARGANQRPSFIGNEYVGKPL